MTGYGVINIEGNHPYCLEYGGVSGLTKGGSNLFPDRLRRTHFPHPQDPPMLRLMDALEDLEDVGNVYANFDIDDTQMEALIH